MNNCKVTQYKKGTNNDNLKDYGYGYIKLNNVSANCIIIGYRGTNDYNVKIKGATFADGTTEKDGGLDSYNPSGSYQLLFPKYNVSILTVKSTPEEDAIPEMDLSEVKYSPYIRKLILRGGKITGNINELPINGGIWENLEFPYSNVEGNIENMAEYFVNSASLSTYAIINLFSTKVTGNLKTFLDTLAASVSNGDSLRINIKNSLISTEGLEWSTSYVTHIVHFDGQGYTIGQS